MMQQTRERSTTNKMNACHPGLPLGPRPKAAPAPAHSGGPLTPRPARGPGSGSARPSQLTASVIATLKGKLCYLRGCPKVK